MAKRPTSKDAVYHIAARRKLIGIIYNAPDAETAIKRAIEEYKVPPNERGVDRAAAGLMPSDGTI